MSGMQFEIAAVWDEAAKVWISETNIIGLHIEAETLEAFEHEVHEHASDLILRNHIDRNDWATKSLRDLIPTIFLRAAKHGPSLG